MNEMKWILDFEIIEEIHKKGYADVKVKDIIEMCGDTITRTHQLENDMRLCKYDMLSEDAKQRLISGNAKLRDLAVDIFNKYKLRDKDEVIRFSKVN